MKRSITSAVVLSTVFMSAGALAANEIDTLTINGTVESSSCYFKNGDAKSIIALPNIDTSHSSGLSTGVTIGDEKRDNNSTPMAIVRPVGTELNTVRVIGAQFTPGVPNKTSGNANGISFNLALDDKQITDAEESDLKNELTAEETNDGIEYTLDFKAKYTYFNSDIPVTTRILSSVLAISVPIG